MTDNDLTLKEKGKALSSGGFWKFSKSSGNK